MKYNTRKKPEFVTLTKDENDELRMWTSKGNSPVSRHFFKYINVIKEGDNVDSKKKYDYTLILDDETFELLE
jgi:hypothetical protein